MTGDIEISVVMVSYGAKYFLAQSILAAKIALEKIPHEIILIDNASPDDTPEYINSLFPDITLVRNNENLGFARANNIGINMATGRFTLILNPDTIVTRTAINKAIQWMNSHPHCGAIGTRMIDGCGNFLPESKRGFPSPWTSFCKIFGLSSLFPRSKRFAGYHCIFLDDRKPHKVSILAGAYMFVRTDLLKKTGGFDERFFMYGEDIDLSWRLSTDGFSNWYLPYNIIHYKGESTKKDSLRYLEVFYEAMTLFFEKYYPGYSRGYSFFIKSGIKLRHAADIVLRLFPKRSSFKKPSAIYVLSDSPEDVFPLLDSPAKKIASPESFPKNTRLIIDDRIADYDNLVNMIDSLGSKHREIAIYCSFINKILIPSNA